MTHSICPVIFNLANGLIHKIIVTLEICPCNFLRNFRLTFTFSFVFNIHTTPADCSMLGHIIRIRLPISVYTLCSDFFLSRMKMVYKKKISSSRRIAHTVTSSRERFLFMRNWAIKITGHKRKVIAKVLRWPNLWNLKKFNFILESS